VGPGSLCGARSGRRSGFSRENALPAKAGPTAESPATSSVLLVQFFQLLLDPVALEVGQVIDEQFAVQVIAFMLDAYRQQTFGDFLVRLAVTIQGLDADFLRAVDVLIEAWHRKTAFLIL